MESKSIYLSKLKQLKAAKRDIEVLEGEVEKSLRRYQKDLIEEKLSKAEAYIGGLNLKFIRDKLCSNNDAYDLSLNEVDIVTTGYGPWDESEFDSFLLERNFQLYQMPSPEAKILILGQGGVDPDLLMSQINLIQENGRQIKVYTQELFVYWLISKEDPLVFWSEDELLQFVEDEEHRHWSLTYLIQNVESFVWPDTCVDDGFSRDWDVEQFTADDWQSESVLHKLGYTVADGKLTSYERRKVLETAFKDSHDRLLNTPDLKKKWGLAKSAQRLYAIAGLLSWLAGFQGRTKPQAREKWLADLLWIKNEFYDSRMKFSWPRAYASNVSAKKIVSYI